MHAGVRALTPARDTQNTAPDSFPDTGQDVLQRPDQLDKIPSERETQHVQKLGRFHSVPDQYYLHYSYEFREERKWMKLSHSVVFSKPKTDL